MATQHTKDVAAATAIVKEFGLTNSQARRSLQQSVATNILIAQGQRNVANAQEVIEADKKRMEIKVVEQKTETKNLPLPPLVTAPPAAGMAGPANAVGSTVRALVVVVSDDDPPVYTAVVYNVKYA